MLTGLRQRFDAWRAPAASRRRRAERRLEWQAAQDEAEARWSQTNPRPPEFFNEPKHDPPK